MNELLPIVFVQFSYPRGKVGDRCARVSHFVVAYSVLATRLWNSIALPGFNLLQSASVLKRLMGAALDLVHDLFGSALSKAARISFIVLLVHG